MLKILQFLPVLVWCDWFSKGTGFTSPFLFAAGLFLDQTWGSPRTMWWCTCRGPWRVHLLTFSSLLARVKGTKTTTLCSTETWNILLRKCFASRFPSTFLSNSSNQQSKNQLTVANIFFFNYSLSGRNVRFYLYRKHSISTLTQAF